MGVSITKYRSIVIPLNIGIELSQVLRYFDISLVGMSSHVVIDEIRLGCHSDNLGDICLNANYCSHYRKPYFIQYWQKYA